MAAAVIINSRYRILCSLLLILLILFIFYIILFSDNRSPYRYQRSMWRLSHEIDAILAIDDSTVRNRLFQNPELLVDMAREGERVIITIRDREHLSWGVRTDGESVWWLHGNEWWLRARGIRDGEIVIEMGGEMLRPISPARSEIDTDQAY